MNDQVKNEETIDRIIGGAVATEMFEFQSVTDCETAERNFESLREAGQWS